MEAIIIACLQEQAAIDLAAALDKSIANVARYRKGRRVGGGIRHVAETWLRRVYPEGMLQANVLLVLTESDVAHNALDETLSVVACQANPTDFEVRLLALASNHGSGSLADSSVE